MDIGLIIFIGLLIIAGIYFMLNRKKPNKLEEKKVNGFANLQVAISDLERKGEVQDEDFVVAIISIDEFNSKTPKEIENWIKGKFNDKEGTLSNYEVDGLGLKELDYTSDNRVYKVFFLIVEETANNVIDWKEPKDDFSDPIIEVSDLETSTGEQIEKDYTNTRILREQFKEDNKIYKLPKGKFYTYGILPNDPADRAYRNEEGDLIGVVTGEYGGTVNIKDVSNVTVIGSGDNETTLFTIKPAVEQYYPNATNRRILSKRKFIEFTNAQNPFVYNISVESNNIPNDGGRSQYIYPFEFEHGIDADRSNFVHIEKFTAKNIWGDGVYIRGCDDVYIRDVIIENNGRQGGALISGARGYIEKYKVLNGTRAGFDIEGNTVTEDSKDFVITYSYFKNKLIGLPMGGRGFVQDVLSINNIYMDSPIWSRGDGEKRRRKNIMFVRNKARELGRYDETPNVLIDGIEQDGLGYNKLILGQIRDCTNVTIRNCDLPNYGRLSKGEEPFFYIWSIGTPLSEFKIYNNKQPIAILMAGDESIDFSKAEKDVWYHVDSSDFELAQLAFEENYGGGEIVRNPKENFVLKEGQELKLLRFHFPEYAPTEEEAASIPFETSEWMEMQWDRLYTNGYGWREEDYVDDGWRPKWVKENYKKIGI